MPVHDVHFERCETRNGALDVVNRKKVSARIDHQAPIRKARCIRDITGKAMKSATRVRPGSVGEVGQLEGCLHGMHGTKHGGSGD